MFVQAAQAGGAQGLQVAQMRQQSEQQDAARQAAQQEMMARLLESRDQAAINQQAKANAFGLDERQLALKDRLGSAELAMREAENRNTRGIRGEANELRRLELDRGVAMDAINKTRIEGQMRTQQSAQDSASKAISEIMAGAPVREVAFKYPDALVDPRMKQLLKLEESGPVAPPGSNPLRRNKPPSRVTITPRP